MPRLTLALIAHDRKKDDMQAFCLRHRDRLSGFDLIAARIAVGEVAAVIFLVDPLYAHPHEPDIQSLLRVCNVHNIPVATNLSTAESILLSLAGQTT